LNIDLSKIMGWIHRMVLITLALSFLTVVSTSYMESVNIVINNRMDSYQEHAAALAVLGGGAERGVQSDWMNENSEIAGCDHFYLGGGRFVFNTSDRDGKCPLNGPIVGRGGLERPGQFYLQVDASSGGESDIHVMTVIDYEDS